MQHTPKLPTLPKINIPLTWCKLFQSNLYEIFGVRKNPLQFVIRKSDSVTPELETIQI